MHIIREIPATDFLKKCACSSKILFILILQKFYELGKKPVTVISGFCQV